MPCEMSYEISSKILFAFFVFISVFILSLVLPTFFRIGFRFGNGLGTLGCCHMDERLS